MTKKKKKKQFWWKHKLKRINALLAAVYSKNINRINNSCMNMMIKMT